MTSMAMVGPIIIWRASVHRIVGVVVFAIVALGRVSLASASSNYNYNVYNYDQAPTFTPDGRLLQVEYASTAAELSSPLLAIQVNNETMVLMTTKSSTSPQNRIIIIPSASGDGKRFLPSSICVAMSGVLADSIALVQVGLKETAKEYQRLHAPMSILKFAMSMANACQSHSFGGGIRPYGCTVLTCGFSSTGEVVMYQTDPSGALLEGTFQDSGPSPFLRCLVGGKATLQRKLRKRLDQTLGKMQGKETPPLLDILSQVGSILLKETQKMSDKDTTTTKGAPESNQVTFEVVVLNRTLGCYRLSRTQVRSIGDRR